MSSTACGGYLNDRRGLVTTPRFPSQYGINLNCQWVVHVRQGRAIQVKFLDIDIASSDDTCAQDYLMVSNKQMVIV